MAIEFGVIDHLDRQNVPVHETYDSRLQLIELYERAGFSTFHITEHHFTPLGLAPSPLIFLAAASRITQRIRFAPLVLLLPLYNPLRLASEICMLDHLSKGRLDIGAGRGISPYELGFYNVNHLEAQSIYQEAYDVLMMALTRETVDYRGQYFKYFGVPIEMRPYQQPHPPLWYASSSPEGAAWAGSQGHHVAFLAPTSRAKVLIEAYKNGRAGAKDIAARPSPKIGITRHIYVAETDEAAHAEGAEGYWAWYEKFAALWQKYDPRPPASREDVLRRDAVRIITGSPRSVRDEIARQIDETGANYFITRFAYGNLTHAQSVRSLDLFVSEVMPHFRAAKAS
jgi:alkanesulfonate monooxygenase SsuD/methylene tetrahydromethanopterin reductase-like flavin-dependent oxidoreductase (luciferase family)